MSFVPFSFFTSSQASCSSGTLAEKNLVKYQKNPLSFTGSSDVRNRHNPTSRLRDRLAQLERPDKQRSKKNQKSVIQPKTVWAQKNPANLFCLHQNRKLASNATR